MKKLLFCAVALLLLGWPGRMHSRDVIGMYDLGYTLQTDLATAEGRNTAWDDVHLVAALQGIVNRDAARLYVYFVERDGVGIDRYWFDKYRRRGQWLYGKETVTYGTIEELVEAYAGYVEGVVLYDGNVPSTSNVASSVAGSDDLLPVRYDPRRRQPDVHRQRHHPRHGPRQHRLRQERPLHLVYRKLHEAGQMQHGVCRLLH